MLHSSQALFVLNLLFSFFSTGGHAKTLMFVHINPEINALGETISTLKFAERVATINLGAAQSNKETGEIREFKEEVSISSNSCTILLLSVIAYFLLSLALLRSQTSS